jgi:hypothetical protein
MYWRLGPWISFMTRRQLRIQYKVNGGQQEVSPVSLGYERIHGGQGIMRQLHALSEHDDGKAWFDLLDLSRDDCAIQKAEVVLEHNCIHGPRHKQPQTVGTVGRGYQLVSVFLQ